MPERSQVTQVVQIGVEATPGALAAANRQLTMISIEPRMEDTHSEFRPIGFKFTTQNPLGKEWTTAAMSGRGNYTEVLYPLSCAFGTATVLMGGTTASATAWVWTFKPSVSAEDTIKTLTVEQGSSVRAHRASYFICNEYGMSFTREEVGVSGAWVGQQIVDGITLTASPVVQPQVLILPQQCDVYLDPTAANIGVTQLTRCLRVTPRVSGIWGQVWPINSAGSSWAAHYAMGPTAEVALLLEADAAGMAQLPHMRSSDTQFLRVQALGGSIAGTSNYRFRWDMAVQLKSAPPFSDEDGLFATEWTYNIVYDSGFAKAFSIEVVNAIGTATF